LHEDLSREVLAEHLRIMASVAEVIDVDEAYEKAIENALSRKDKRLYPFSPLKRSLLQPRP